MAHGVHFPGCSATSEHSCSCEIRRYVYILLITFLIAAIQFVGSAVSGSLALLADTLHVLLDGASAGISVYVAYRVRTHADPMALRLWGMRASGVVLLAALGWVALEAIDRFQHPTPVVGWEVMTVAAIGGYLNYVQHRLVPHDHSVTAKAQRLHVLGDLGSSVAVVLGGALIWLTGLKQIDPLLSLGVAAFIGYSTLSMLLTKHADPGCGHTH